jgi:hypothetical protein
MVPGATLKEIPDPREYQGDSRSQMQIEPFSIAGDATRHRNRGSTAIHSRSSDTASGGYRKSNNLAISGNAGTKAPLASVLLLREEVCSRASIRRTCARAQLLILGSRRSPVTLNRENNSC